jgi:hypothetical protein
VPAQPRPAALAGAKPASSSVAREPIARRIQDKAWSYERNRPSIGTIALLNRCRALQIKLVQRCEKGTHQTAYRPAPFSIGTRRHRDRGGIYARKQFEVWSEQAKEIAALTQKVTIDTAEPVKAGVTNAFKKSRLKPSS